MSRQTFENYGTYAEHDVSFTRLAGRYSIQTEGECKIIGDVASKLDLNPSDSLLEIGCGPGNLLIPLSFLTAKATGVDHPKVIKRFRKRFQDENLQLLAGNFLDMEFSTRFTKILIYSMIQLLSNEAEVRTCLSKALGLLEPGGLLLVGDLPNEDKKNRFLASRTGQKFLRDWNKKNTENGMSVAYGKLDKYTVNFTDRLILDLMVELRGSGCETYLLSQPPNLPFGRTREDLLVRKLEV